MNLAGAISRLRIQLYRLSNRHCAISMRASIHYTVELTASTPVQIAICPDVRIDKDSWINVPSEARRDQAAIRIGNSTRIGRNNVLSARNYIEIEEECLLGPQVLLMDHAHDFTDCRVPIMRQGVTEGGRIILERGCWIGFGSAIICSRGELRVGSNSVVGANSVVTQDVPPRTIVAGSPARVIRQYDESLDAWTRSSNILPT